MNRLKPLFNTQWHIYFFVSITMCVHLHIYGMYYKYSTKCLSLYMRIFSFMSIRPLYVGLRMSVCLSVRLSVRLSAF